MGFKTNGYNECTFNKMINGYQCTIQVHVDDLKLSHSNQNELNKIIDILNKIFGSDRDLLTVSHRKIHKYIGITIDWTTEGVVVFTIYDYSEDIPDEAPTDFDGKDVTPAVSELFTVNLMQRKLDTSTAVLLILYTKCPPPSSLGRRYSAMKVLILLMLLMVPPLTTYTHDPGGNGGNTNILFQLRCVLVTSQNALTLSF